MRCLKCGFVNDDRKKYCFFCGMPVSDESLSNEPDVPAVQPVADDVEKCLTLDSISHSEDGAMPVEGGFTDDVSPIPNQATPVPKIDADLTVTESVITKNNELSAQIPHPSLQQGNVGAVKEPKLEKRLRILIAGGYGFIGSAVAERCHQEGHYIFVLDNLSTGKKQRITFGHTFYQQSIEDSECQEIFKSNHFDVVMHFASREDPNPQEGMSGGGANSHIAGLVNLLELSSEYGVKKFIFSSSATVYGKNCDLPFVEDSLGEPTSINTVNQLTAEFYCRKWAEIYGLKTVIFRISKVYGPKESLDGSIIYQALATNTLKIENNALQTHDYIYIGDVVDGIYRSISRKTSDVLNLSTNTETSLEELGALLKEALPTLEIIRPEAQQDNGLRSCLNNTRAKQELNWKPRYSLDQGIAKTLQWRRRHPNWSFDEVAASSETAKKTERWSWLPYFENGLAFVIVTAATNAMKYNADYHMLDLKLIYILMMGIMYGMVHSMIATGLSIILYVVMALSVGNDIFAMINDPINLGQMMVYLLIGLYTGYSTDRRNREIAAKEMQLVELKEKNTFISELNQQNHLIQEELQNQIINFEDSYGKIYDITREIDSLEPENIINASISLVENVMKSDAVSIYMVNKAENFLRLIAKSKQLDIPKSIALDQVPELAEFMKTKDIFVNKSLNPKLPMLIAAITDQDKIVAIVALHNLEFGNINMYYRNLFKVLVGFISSALLRAYRYEEATYLSRRVNGTIVLNEVSFKRILQLRMEAKTKSILQYSVLQIDEFDINDEPLLYKLVTLIREVDCIGYGNKGIYILLTNANQDEAKHILNRLEKHKLYARIVNDESERILG